MIYSRARVPGSCLTSIVPLDMGYFTPQAGYEPVMTPAGAIADLNQGLPASDPIYLFTSTMTENPAPAFIELAFNSTGQFRVAHFSDLHLTSFAAECRDVPKEVRSAILNVRYHLLTRNSSWRTAPIDSRLDSCPGRWT